ncbi:carbohydrate ABC transporter substrate-binding protein, CUT1 family [Streptomyces misionensis]|uniref:Carbohydrate ABC transporter substrate-binding protein, CUT1 family n=1 Tax=Streptomyces misionensis TaxID=67331 RepID=A0A1H5G8E5_9ACTN|nr:extracellular solute-binding protein [Streptomyces misionensis]SEE11781.1 carbohydrate ABC transporter substrate-binding protein, CUT1 family [Streptomyces misionensis]
MSRKTRGATAVAIGLGVALAAAGCAGGGDTGNGGGSSNGKVTLTLWENAQPGPGEEYWKAAVKEYHQLHPNVTVRIQAVQNEDFDGKLQTALNSNSAPDIFLQRGGGKMQAMVDAGQIQPLNLTAGDKANAGEASVAGYSIDGKVYAMPVDTQPEGIYYSKDLFKKAGITAPPTTMDELAADVAKLKAAGVAPIAVGAKDAWPAAHWYYNLALRECGQDTMTKAGKELKFTDPCWTKAGDDLASFLKADPFQKGFLTTSSQQGAGSSAGMVANHKAAMELMGNWQPGVYSTLTPDKKQLPDLGWFPFPKVNGGQGDPSAIMGGLDGFSLSKNAPKEAFGFLEFLVTKDQQQAYAKAFFTIPVNKDAQKVVTEPYNVSALDAFNKAPYSMMFLDTMYGQNVGNAMNTAVVNLMAGKGSAADIARDTNAAAAKG